ncbi:hypothetical protein DOTSEDRAFT_20563 [Dothistroma septosporum NZE10]|uniref:Uncharacterized protein n=1 Tax=Dothistroma septosporum (strain NZE10 / CBS 128990) TaxID=675120 RepID=N1Q338_DOTSN|nr:hypothetical protein DOTSEDRAFT_20563 [Dothistroma septosporum NZE10]
MKDPLPLRWLCCCCPCGPTKPTEKSPSELERDIGSPPTATKLEDDNAYIAEVAINMALRRSTETAERTSLDIGAPIREEVIEPPPPSYDSVWTERPAIPAVRSLCSNSVPMMSSNATSADRDVATSQFPVESQPLGGQNDVKAISSPALAMMQHRRQSAGDAEAPRGLEEDSDFESRISTPRTLTPPTTVPPTLVDGDEDEERRRWVRVEDGGVRRG